MNASAPPPDYSTLSYTQLIQRMNLLTTGYIRAWSSKRRMYQHVWASQWYRKPVKPWWWPVVAWWHQHLLDQMVDDGRARKQFWEEYRDLSDAIVQGSSYNAWAHAKSMMTDKTDKWEWPQVKVLNKNRGKAQWAWWGGGGAIVSILLGVVAVQGISWSSALALLISYPVGLLTRIQAKQARDAYAYAFLRGPGAQFLYLDHLRGSLGLQHIYSITPYLVARLAQRHDEWRAKLGQFAQSLAELPPDSPLRRSRSSGGGYSALGGGAGYAEASRAWDDDEDTSYPAYPHFNTNGMPMVSGTDFDYAGHVYGDTDSTWD